MIPIVVLDANVLFPMILRDVLLRVSAAGCYRAHWSARILDEMSRNLMLQHRVSEAGAMHLAMQMKQGFPEAEVEGWEPLEAAMTNDPKDRHVAAVAAHIGAKLIVTQNLKDFASLPTGVKALSADTFLVGRFQAMPASVLLALRKQQQGYKNPPASLDELLDWLAEEAPEFVRAVRGSLSGGSQA